MKRTAVTNKVPVAILGTGNIGTDLLFKIERSPYLRCALFSGKRADSPGIAKARSMGIATSDQSIEALKHHHREFDIIFDATTAESHKRNGPVFKRLKKFIIDMTPSRYGIMCCPILNLNESLKKSDVNMISCGGQANTPIISAIMAVHPDIRYVEIVSSIASKSAGIGTRDNIDEYTQTTCDAITALTGAPRAKAIVILNPADPPIRMHNTIYAKFDHPDIRALKKSIKGMEKQMREYIPGFHITAGPVFENNRITVMSEVVGVGDYLPVYAGNLDIINCTAIEVAEAWVKKRLHT